MLPLQRLIVLSAAFLALGLTWAAIGLFRAPASEVIGPVLSGADPVGQSQPASGVAAAPAQLTVDVASAVQAPGRVNNVGRMALDSIEWNSLPALKTVDGSPAGGELKFHKGKSKVEVCDTEQDGHLVRGRVTLHGEVVRARDGTKLTFRAGAYDKCYVKGIKNYDPAKKYKFEVCLARSDDHPDGYCNSSNSKKWPKADKEEDYCESSDRQGSYADCVGGAEEACHLLAGPVKEDCIERNGGGSAPGEIFSTEKPDVVGPPGGRAPSINDKPDAALPDGPASGYDDARIAKPARKMLKWLTWATLGACVAGFMMVGANMAIKHKKGEVGKHAADLGWVLIATVVAGTGLAIYFVGRLVIPI